MSVDAVVFYRVSNATISVANVEDSHHSTRLLAQTTLRNVLGTKNLHEILSQRESISSSMQVGARECLRYHWASYRSSWTRRPVPGGSSWRESRCESHHNQH